MLALLMSLDGMHFVQTRIATIDSFGVLFIILMFLFMFWYYSISFYDVPLKKTFIPLGLCGLSFGLGAASKWICLYAGVGLAIIFFITMARRIKECALARKNLENPALSPQQKAYLKKISDTCVLNICYTVLFCILVFIIIPLVIYCLSYYPYWNVQGESRPWYKIVWDNQVSMYTYHSTLDATHGFQSDWYTWPVIYRPMWFYAGKELPQGQMECISTFGNPIVWYMGLVCTLLALVSFVCKITSNKNLAEKHETGILRIFDCGDADLSDKTERDKNLLLFAFIGIACNLLPWVGISRCIFIYHYFASVPFIMIFTVYIYREIARKNKKVAAILSVLLIIVALILFIMFKPIWTGTQVSKDYVNTYLRWFESWIFGS